MVNQNAETVFSAALQRNHLARSGRPLEDEVKPSALGVFGNLVAFPDEQQIGLVGFLFVDQDVLRCLGCPEILQISQSLAWPSSGRVRKVSNMRSCPCSCHLRPSPPNLRSRGGKWGR